MLELVTTRGTVYTLADDGAVLARSNGPQGWDYSGKWRIVGFKTRHNANAMIPLAEVAKFPHGHGTTSDLNLGQGWIVDLDHGTYRMWGTERLRTLRAIEVPLTHAE